MYLRKGRVWIRFVAVGLPKCFEAWQAPWAFLLVYIQLKVVRNMFQVKAVCVGMYCTFYSLRCNINRCVKSDKRSSGIRTEMKCANKIIAERRNVKFNSSAFRVSKETGKQTNKRTNKKWRRLYSCFLLHEGNAQKILELLFDIIFLEYMKYVGQCRAYNALGILNNTNNIVNNNKNRCYIKFVDWDLLCPVVVASARWSWRILCECTGPTLLYISIGLLVFNFKVTVLPPPFPFGR